MSDASRAPFDAAELVKTLPNKPGVYRMLDAAGTVLYVGKARNLKKRVGSYFQRPAEHPKTQAMLAHVNSVEITVTHNETEALLLENNLIKSLRPRYNITLRDDKSYPYIVVVMEHEFPRLAFYRGTRRERGRYFGPYPSASSARETLHLMQKIFPVRQCEDAFYRNRSRPCLQYQIKRCTAPCVGLVSKETYLEDVRHATLFLEGKNTQVVDALVARMEQAAAQLQYEQAARYRDQIASLKRILDKQYMSGEGGDLDIIAGVVKQGIGCVQVFYVRGGRNLGNKTFFPKSAAAAEAHEILAAFIPQYYLGDAAHGQASREVPAQILLNHEVEDVELLTEALTQQAQRKIQIVRPERGGKVRWVELAQANAQHAIDTFLVGKATTLARFDALQEVLQLDSVPQRLECFDISHTMGEATVASCVVFDTQGPAKADYRRFNIKDITPGDDYAAMRQALLRRYTRLQQEEGKLPDILFIDGGKGQLTQAEQVLAELQVEGVILIGIAKGVDRKPGMETLFLSGQERPLILPPDSPALLLVQQIRDEAHRFAISGHRQRRAKARTTSVLEGIKGLGAKRRHLLLKQFGGLQELTRAGVEDLTRVHGISVELAQRIYDVLHSN
ncbi:MAG: excinuclease ABC subunit UvrC [Gammaproteobacteria bacterium]|nr:excinuclease ABC subunit UvrC [Gammaproteobacteria bacterium]